MQSPHLLEDIIRRQVANLVNYRTIEAIAENLETNPQFKPHFSIFKTLLLDPNTSHRDLVSYVQTQLPADEPDHLKVVFLEVVARMFGRDWITDDCDALQVTIGTSRLQLLAQTFSARLSSVRAQSSAQPVLSILTPSGEQHTLMSQIASVMFQSVGWQVNLLNCTNVCDVTILSEVAASDVICLSWSHQRLQREMFGLVNLLSTSATRSDQLIIAGGIATTLNADVLTELGVDHICQSIYSALEASDNFIFSKTNFSNTLHLSKPVEKSELNA